MLFYCLSVSNQCFLFIFFYKYSLCTYIQSPIYLSSYLSIYSWMYILFSRYALTHANKLLQDHNQDADRHRKYIDIGEEVTER